MDDQLERSILVTEIVALEGQMINAGLDVNPDLADPRFLESFLTRDLVAIKKRLDHLARSLGGTRR